MLQRSVSFGYTAEWFGYTCIYLYSFFKKNSSPLELHCVYTQEEIYNWLTGARPQTEWAPGSWKGQRERLFLCPLSGYDITTANLFTFFVSWRWVFFFCLFAFWCFFFNWNPFKTLSKWWTIQDQLWKAEGRDHCKKPRPETAVLQPDSFLLPQEGGHRQRGIRIRSELILRTTICFLRCSFSFSWGEGCNFHTPCPVSSPPLSTVLSFYPTQQLLYRDEQYLPSGGQSSCSSFRTISWHRTWAHRLPDILCSVPTGVQLKNDLVAL